LGLFFCLQSRNFLQLINKKIINCPLRWFQKHWDIPAQR
jgi:hypothetical protein